MADPKIVKFLGIKDKGHTKEAETLRKRRNKANDSKDCEEGGLPKALSYYSIIRLLIVDFKKTIIQHILNDLIYSHVSNMRGS